jgi:hypothetical protein
MGVTFRTIVQIRLEVFCKTDLSLSNVVHNSKKRLAIAVKVLVYGTASKLFSRVERPLKVG